MHEYSDLEVHHPPNCNPAIIPSIQPDQPSTYTDLPYPKSLNEQDPSSRRGIGRWTLAGLAALLTAAVVGGALGGGLGASLKSCQNQKSVLSANPSLGSQTVPSSVTFASDLASSNTVSAGTATSTSLKNYLAPDPSDVSTLFLDCQDGVIQERTYWTSPFHVYCGTDFGSGQASTAKLSDGSTLNYVDVLNIIAYSSSHCMQACLDLNYWNDKLGRPSSAYCRAIRFTAELSTALSDQGGNCWLKNGTPADTGSFTVSDRTKGLSATLERT